MNIYKGMIYIVTAYKKFPIRHHLNRDDKKTQLKLGYDWPDLKFSSFNLNLKVKIRAHA